MHVQLWIHMHKNNLQHLPCARSPVLFFNTYTFCAHKGRFNSAIAVFRLWIVGAKLGSEPALYLNCCPGWKQTWQYLAFFPLMICFYLECSRVKSVIARQDAEMLKDRDKWMWTAGSRHKREKLKLICLCQCECAQNAFVPTLNTATCRGNSLSEN